MASKKKYSRPAHAVITLPDPDDSPVSSHAQVGGRIEWRCETPDYPKFEILFGKRNPFNSEENYVAKGTIDKPVVLKAENQGNFKYRVRHYPAKGGPPVESGFINTQVRPCPGCPPVP